MYLYIESHEVTKHDITDCKNTSYNNTNISINITQNNETTRARKNTDNLVLEGDDSAMLCYCKSSDKKSSCVIF